MKKVNFELGNEMDKEHIWVPDRNRTHDLPNTWPITSHDQFDSADPSSMQDAFTYELT